VGGVLGFAKEVLHLAGGMATEAVRGVLFGAALEGKDRVLDESFRNLGIIAVGLPGPRPRGLSQGRGRSRNP